MLDHLERPKCVRHELRRRREIKYYERRNEWEEVIRSSHDSKRLKLDPQGAVSCFYRACTKRVTGSADLYGHVHDVHYGNYYHCLVPDCSNNKGHGYLSLDRLKKHVQRHELVDEEYELVEKYGLVDEKHKLVDKKYESVDEKDELVNLPSCANAKFDFGGSESFRDVTQKSGEKHETNMSQDSALWKNLYTDLFKIMGRGISITEGQADDCCSFCEAEGDFSYLETDIESEEYSSVYEEPCGDIQGELLKLFTSSKATSAEAAAFEIMKRALVDRIMNALWVTYDRKWTAKVKNYASIAGSSCSNSVSKSNSTTSVSNQAPSGNNRKRSRGSEGGSTSDADDNNSQSSRSNSRNPQYRKRDLKLACPFRKHDPLKYNLQDYRICALSSWSSIARVKEHLNRVHKAPIYCERCKLQFKAIEALKSHLTVPDSKFCRLQEGPAPGGIGPELAIKLKSRKKSSASQSDPERWKDIFRILFPEELVPMPYFEPVLDSAMVSPDDHRTLNFEEFYRRELPRAFKARLDDAVSEKLKSLDDYFKTELVNMVKDCHMQLALDYQSHQRNIEFKPLSTSAQHRSLPARARPSGARLQTISNLSKGVHLESAGELNDRIAQTGSLPLQQSTFPLGQFPESFWSIPSSRGCFCMDSCTCPDERGPSTTAPTHNSGLAAEVMPDEAFWGDDLLDESWVDNFLRLKN